MDFNNLATFRRRGQDPGCGWGDTAHEAGLHLRFGRSPPVWRIGGACHWKPGCR